MMENWQENSAEDAQDTPAGAQQSADGNGRRTVVLHPAPVLKDVTLDVAERGLRMMGVELDDFMQRDDPPPDPHPPKMSQAQAFFDVVLENADAYDLAAMPLDRAQGAVAVVAANFYVGCLATSAGQPVKELI